MNPKPIKFKTISSTKLVQILEQKNKSLEKFYNLSREGLTCFQQGDFSQIKNFYLVREGLLKNIGQLDKQLENLGDIGDPSLKLKPNTHIRIRQLQKIRRHWVTQILWQDLRMLSFVEKAKSNMIYQLQERSPTKRRC